MRAVGHETPQTVHDWSKLGDLLRKRGRLKLKALGWDKHGDVPRQRRDGT